MFDLLEARCKPEFDRTRPSGWREASSLPWGRDGATAAHRCDDGCDLPSQGHVREVQRLIPGSDLHFHAGSRKYSHSAAWSGRPF